MSSAGHYLRWPRFFFFQLTSLLCLACVSLASWGLKVGGDLKHEAANTIPGAKLYIQDALNVGGGVTAAAGVASLLCLAMNILGHFYPHKRETLKTVRMKEAAFALACCLWIGTLIPATISFATKSGVIKKPGVPDAVIAQIVKLSGKNLAYSAQTPIKAYVIVGWVAFLSTLINLILVSLAARHVLHNGPGGEQGQLVPGHSSPHHEEMTQATSIGSEKAALAQHEAQETTVVPKVDESAAARV